MCGIVGYISTADNIFRGPKAHFMRFALALDTLRGHDSTGIMTLSDEFKIKVIKTTMPGDKFVHSERYIKKVEPGWAQVGHNRAATKGSVKLENAHPFIFGDVTLVHNGTLWKEGESLSTFDTNLEVDSMQIANALATHTPEESKAVLENIDGSFALVWFDRRNASINMARNTDRPLHFGYNTARTIMWFMSDGQHLSSINRSLKGHESAATTVYALDKHKMITWHKGNLVPEVTPFVPFVRPAPKPVAVYNHAANRKTALQKSAERWQGTCREANGVSTPTSTSGYGFKTDCEKTQVNGGLRKIPNAHLKCLKEEFDLTPDDLLEFQPEELIDLKDHKMVIAGSVILPDWNNCPWEAVIYNAKQVQAKAYRSYSWLVRPIGIGPAMKDLAATPSILCHLIHCSWHDYNNAKMKEAADVGKADTGLEVPGPDGRMVPLGELRSKCDKGCVSCGGALEIGSLENCTYVNEGRDILCPACQQDLVRGMTTMLSKNLMN